MKRLPIPASPVVDSTEFGKPARSPDIGEEFLAQSKAYLECRSRGGEPPPPLVEAWKCFYEFYAPRIRGFLKSCSVPEADLNDCSQEVWQDVVADLARFRQDASRGRLSTWIRTLARNKAVDSIRRRNRHVSETLEFNESIAPMDPEPGPDAKYERRQTLAQVQRILLELSGKVSQTNFQVLYLRWMEGLPTAEVAAALELTPEQVRFRSHRMKRKFRELLEQSMEQDVSDSPHRPTQNEWRIDRMRNRSHPTSE
jgi:RNA polymerase sigma factor (sigma-70 family)